MSQTKHRVPMQTQQAVAAYIVMGLIFLWSTGSLWAHIDAHSPDYGWMKKAGLFGVDFIAYQLLTWKLYGVWAFTRAYCMAAHFLLAIAMIVHAGATLQYDASSRAGAESLKAVGEAQAKIAAETARAAVGAAGENAARLKGAGAKRGEVNAALNSGNALAQAVAAEAGKNITATAAQTKGTTFLPESYTNGGMYIVLFVLALVLFAGAYVVFEFAAQREDANGNGIPDFLESGRRRVGFVGVSPAPATAQDDDEEEDAPRPKAPRR